MTRLFNISIFKSKIHQIDFFQKLIYVIACTVVLISGINKFSFGQTLVINEILSSNVTGITDILRDNEDWIEIYNYGEQDINLAGYGLSDNLNNPFKWVFPNVIINGGEFMLIWASGKDRNNPNGALHTNFSIAQEGEELLLTCPDGHRIDELEPVMIPTDVSYGRKPDGSDNWYFFDEPTPGEPNITKAYSEILKSPVFSKTGGSFPESFELTISHPDPEAIIVYTLDGSEPCINNLTGKTYFYKNQYPEHVGDPFGELIPASYKSNLYDAPITIKDRSKEPDKLTQISTTWHFEPEYFPENPVFKGTVVRAKAFKEDALPSTIQSGSYFITYRGRRRYSLPIISLSIQEDYLFDYENGIYVAGEVFDNYRLANPEVAAHGHITANYMRRGDNYEYPANIEVIDPEKNSSLLNQNIGIRIHGSLSRSYRLKSFRLYARSRYFNSHLNYDFFNEGSSQDYKRLILRNSGQDLFHTMFRDGAIQEIVTHMNFDTQAFQSYVVFVNGEYWGILNARERYDRHYLQRVYGVDPDNIDLLTLYMRAKEGSIFHYSKTINFLENNSLEIDSNYRYILTRIDPDNLMDYQIANIYANNTDWPGNNVDFWRYRTDQYEPNAPYGHDGRWRWLMFDADFGFGLRGGAHSFASNTLAYAASEERTERQNPEWATLLLRSFLNNEEFKLKFINRFADQLNTGFKSERAIEVIHNLKNQIEPEIIQHIARWSIPSDYMDWKRRVDLMIEFAEKRPYFMRKHIIEFFDLEGTINVNLDVSNQLKGHIKINTADIHPSTPGVSQVPFPWEGMYFKNIPIEVKAIPAPGYKFFHWEGSSSSTSQVISLKKDQDIQLIAYFEKTDEPILLHYWLFDTSLSNNTPLENIYTSYSATTKGKIEYASCLDGYPFDDKHPDWRRASMERRNSPTPINYRPEGNNNIQFVDTDMRGLQIKQPFVVDGSKNTLIFNMSTEGFSDIDFRFAAKSEDAADIFVVDYSINNKETEWITFGLPDTRFYIAENYRLFKIDFSNIQQVNNNPDFKIRIRFDGKNLYYDDGNRVTFNNISLEGIALDAHTLYSTAGENGEIFPFGRSFAYKGSKKDFLIVPYEGYHIHDILVDGISVYNSLIALNDNNGVYVLPEVSKDHNIYAEFSLHPDVVSRHEGNIIIYPNPATERTTILAIDTITRIDIAGISGQIMYSYSPISSKRYTINTSTFDNGFYIIRVQTNKGVISRKLQIIK